MVKRGARTWTADPGPRPLSSTMALSRSAVSCWLAGALLAACNATVDPIGSGPSSSSTGEGGAAVSTASGLAGGGGIGTGGSGGTGSGGVPSAIALYEGELLGGGGSGTSGGAGGAGGARGGAEGERLFLVIDPRQLSCAGPVGDAPDCASAPVVFIGLPPAYQEKQGTYALDDPLIESRYACGSENGPFVTGTLQITSFGSEQIVATLAGTSPAGLDGPHTIDRCTPFIPYDNRAISYFASDPPGGGAGGGTSTGSSGGDDSFVFELSSHAQSCAEPLGDPPGQDETVYDMIIHIPPDYLAPGRSYALADPSITVTFYEMSSNTGAIGAGGGADMPGTLTILEVTDAYVEVRIEGTGVDYVDGEGQIPRCAGG